MPVNTTTIHIEQWRIGSPWLAISSVKESATRLLFGSSATIIFAKYADLIFQRLMESWGMILLRRIILFHWGEMIVFAVPQWRI
jgi:hypothetical protein